MPNFFSASVYIGLGSNLGNSRSLLLESWHFLGQHSKVEIQALSSPYRTQPVGMESKHWFINAVGQLETTLTPEALLDLLLKTEQQFGRVRHPEQEGYQDRTLDLDLLLYNNCIMQTDRLVLPHPAMHERLFVLIPLAEIGGQLMHPLFRKTVAKLLGEQQEDREEIQGIEQLYW